MAGHVKRKRERAAAMAAESGNSGVVMPSITWDELYGRAEGVLDEDALERLALRKAKAEKRRALMAERGVAQFVDVEAMKRALCAYWADATYGGPMRGFRRVFAAEGTSAGDFIGGATVLYPELDVAYKYIKGLIADLAKSDAEETVALAQAGQRRLLTEEGCGLNQRAVEVSLRATMKDVYGEGGGASGGRDKAASITYSFPNMTLNWIAPPAAGSGKAAAVKAVVPDAIDVTVGEG